LRMDNGGKWFKEYWMKIVPHILKQIAVGFCALSEH
jgi:hypothetical protein